MVGAEAGHLITYHDWPLGCTLDMSVLSRMGKS